MLTIKSKAAALSIASNTLLILLKLFAGIITGSISLIAEAIHSCMDLAAAVIAFVCVRVSDKPVDKKHPFGHGKAENVSGVIEGVLILIAAGIIVNEAIHKITQGVELKIVEVGIATMAISIVVNILVSRYLLKVSKSTDSLALEADAVHLTTDVLTMSGVLLGLIAVKLTGIEIIDPIVALFVALLIVKAAFDIIWKSFGGLMDVSLPESEKAAIEACLLEHNNRIVEFHKLRTRKAGSQRQVDLHLVIPKTASIEEAHNLCDHLETDIGKILPNTVINIHVEPCESTCEDCNVICDHKKKSI
ncbi:MAG: cation diffusion facilitator family transporter [Dehalococcoidales bacterium]|nr:cation diffusion facilitator family transporter [Dehalococcoidales bacterium]